jgi:hypothetical protein
MQIVRQVVAIGIVIVAALGASVSAKAAYRIEHVNWGNENAGADRIYVRDAASGKRVVLSQHWGAQCNKRAALNYGLGGGCWYPVRESYSRWRKSAKTGLRLSHRHRLHAPLLSSANETFAPLARARQPGRRHVLAVAYRFKHRRHRPF